MAQDLSYTTASDKGYVNITDGDRAQLPAATTTVAGLLTGEDKVKLNGIDNGANKITNNNQLTNGAGYITDAGVTKIKAGTNVTISPTNGLGEVTINASGGGGTYQDLQV